MIPVAPVPEPTAFDARCRGRGAAWLATNQNAKRPQDYWTEFKFDLARGFRNLCGFGAMYEPVGSVDHFKSWHAYPHLAYEWTNYRYVSEWINKSKRTADDVLDPYDVQPGWFEISLPDLQLGVSARVPQEFRDIAEHTLTRLHLRDDERVIRQRRAWYEMYTHGRLTLEGLDQVAPLIADAVRRLRSTPRAPTARAESRGKAARKPATRKGKRRPTSRKDTPSKRGTSARKKRRRG